MLYYVRQLCTMMRTYTREQFLKTSVGFDLGLLFVSCHFIPMLFAFVMLGVVSSV